MAADSEAPSAPSAGAPEVGSIDIELPIGPPPPPTVRTNRSLAAVDGLPSARRPRPHASSVEACEYASSTAISMSVDDPKAPEMLDASLPTVCHSGTALSSSPFALPVSCTSVAGSPPAAFSAMTSSLRRPESSRGTWSESGP